MVSSGIRDIINEKSAKYSIDPDLVEAIVMQESTGNTNAIRYEPAFYRTYIRPMNISDHYEENGRATSWGLMQVMGQVARELGFAGDFKHLLDPQYGLEYGCKKLFKCIKKYDDSLDAAIASYNAGTAKYIGTGKLANQAYVDGVKRYHGKIKGAQDERPHQV